MRYCLGKLRKSFGKSVKNKTPVLKLCNPLAIDKIIKSKEKSPIIEPIKNRVTKNKKLRLNPNLCVNVCPSGTPSAKAKLAITEGIMRY